MPLPQKIGEHFTIPAGDYNLRRYVEWHGFVMESSGPGFLKMRRDFSNGVFARTTATFSSDRSPTTAYLNPTVIRGKVWGSATPAIVNLLNPKS